MPGTSFITDFFLSLFIWGDRVVIRAFVGEIQNAENPKRIT